MKEINKRWEKVSERWGLSYERIENAWLVWVGEQINERFYSGSKQPWQRP